MCYISRYTYNNASRYVTSICVFVIRVGTRTLVVEPGGHQVERRHDYGHEHAAQRAAYERAQELLVLGQHAVFDERLAQQGHRAQLRGRPDADAHHRPDGAAPQPPDHAVVAVHRQQAVDHARGLVLMADRDGLRGIRLQVNFQLKNASKLECINQLDVLTNSLRLRKKKKSIRRLNSEKKKRVFCN